MEDLVLSNELTLNPKKDKFINMLEYEIILLNHKIKDDLSLMYNENYLTYIDCLRLLKPNSKVLAQTCHSDCEDVELDSEIMDYWLVKEPVTIPTNGLTIKHTSDSYAKQIKDSLSYGYDLDVLISPNILGLEFRAVYNEGYLLLARLVGKTGLGVDITNQITFLLGEYKEELEEHELCEIRGKITSMTLAGSKGFKNTMSHILEKLFSYTYDSELLCLNIILDNILSEKTYDLTMYDRLTLLNDLGLKTPLFYQSQLSRYDFTKNLNDFVLQIDILSTDYNIPSVGVSIYNNLDCKYICNLELGKWRAYSYESEIDKVIWVLNSNTNDLEPYIHLVEPVVMQDGVEINQIPLYNPANVLILEAYEGNPIHFRYSPKTGAIPLSKDYRLLLSKGLCL